MTRVLVTLIVILQSTHIATAQQHPLQKELFKQAASFCLAGSELEDTKQLLASATTQQCIEETAQGIIGLCMRDLNNSDTVILEAEMNANFYGPVSLEVYRCAYRMLEDAAVEKDIRHLKEKYRDVLRR